MPHDADDDTVQQGWHLPPVSPRDLRLTLARQALRAHDFQRAVVELEELLEELPDDADALKMLACASMELQDWPVARDAWETLVEGGDDRPAVWTQIAVCAFEVGDFESTRDAAERAVAADEDVAEAWSLLGGAQERLGHAAEAQACFDRAHALSPLSFPLPLLLEQSDAREILTQALTEVPEEVASFWSTVPVHILPFPSAEDLSATVPPITPRAVALYEGEPPPRPSRRSRPRGLKVFTGNLAHHDSWESAVWALADALEAEAADWQQPSE